MAHPVCLVVVRHGETVDNVAARIQGQSQGQLTQRGLAQAAALGVRLRGERFDRVYCSDLARARDTLGCCSVACEAHVVYSPLLRERAAGVLEGRPMSAMQDALASAAGVSERHWKPDGGESWADVRERATTFVQDIVGVNNSAGMRVLAVTHGGFIHELMAAAGVRAGGRPGNTALYELTVRRTANGGVACTLVVGNDTSHLPPELAGGTQGNRSA